MSKKIFLFNKEVETAICIEFMCEWCGKIHNQGIGPDDLENIKPAPTHYYYFGDLMIAECCFTNLEMAITSNQETIHRYLGEEDKKRLKIAKKQAEEEGGDDDYDIAP